MAGTREDATMIVELAMWGSMIGLDEASRTIWSDEFDPDSAEVTDPPIQATLMFYETIGTLVRNELLDRELVYDWLWVEGVWGRVGPAATRAREKAGVPQLFENFESLAAGQRLAAGATA